MACQLSDEEKKARAMALADAKRLEASAKRRASNSNRAPDPLPSGSATGGTADSSPVVPPTHSNPDAIATREAGSAGEGGAVCSVSAPPDNSEPDLPEFLDRRKHG